MATRFLVFIFLVSIFSLESSLAQQDQESDLESHLCGDYNYTKGSALDKNVHKVFKTLGANSSRAMYGSDKQGNGNNIVYGQFNCRGDISIQECNNCTQDAIRQIQNACGDTVGNMIWLEKCFLRYENSGFFGELDLFGNEFLNQNGRIFDSAFDNAVQELLNNLSHKTTASTLRYASGSVVQDWVTIYGLVQCWVGLSNTDCKQCLFDCLDWIIRDVSGYEGARILKGSCMARYEIYRFYEANSTKSAPTTNNKRILPIKGNSTQSAPTTNDKGNNVGVIFGVVGSSLALLVLALWLCSICRRSKWLKRLVKKDESFLDRDIQITFTIEELIVATNNFDERLKLGEGGFGVVYKTWKLHQQGSISEMIDEIMRDACDHDQVAKCIHLALLCTQSDSSLRPTMSEVLLLLSNHVDVSKLSNPSTPKLLNFSCSEASSSSRDHSYLPNSSKS